ncbi:MAG: LuxR C-terminal-related transcriptional regulator [Burkholderiaceae bacterium]
MHKRTPPKPQARPTVKAEYAAGELDGKLAELLDALGTPQLAAALLSTLSLVLRCDHLSAFVFDAGLNPHQVMAESLGGAPLAEQAGAMARSWGLHRQDPNTLTVSAAEAPHGEVITTRRRAADMAAGEPALALYQRFDLADRLSLLAGTHTRWFVLNVYRGRAVGEFDDAALAAWQRHARSLSALLRRHFEWQPPPVWQARAQPDNATLEHRLADLPGRLSAREQQVCARALRGMSNPGIAIDLGVQVSTVSTLRRRAFAKLGISTLSELFLLCLWPQA